MAQAARDQNRVTTLLGADSADGRTPIAIKAIAAEHRLETLESTTNYTTNSVAPRDQNYIPVLLAVSAVDGVTPVVVYAEASTGKLLTHQVS